MSLLDFRKPSHTREMYALEELSRKAVESRALDVFKRHGEVSLMNLASGHGGDGLGLDLMNLEVYSNLKDSAIL